MKLQNNDLLEVDQHRLYVNGKLFVVTHPDEPICCIENKNLVTLVIKGCGCTLNDWMPTEVEGHFDK
jgi:hypothetical protein